MSSKQLANYLIKSDPQGEHVSMWAEHWTKSELESAKRDADFLPLRFHDHHPGVRFSNCIEACVQGGHVGFATD